MGGCADGRASTHVVAGRSPNRIGKARGSISHLSRCSWPWLRYSHISCCNADQLKPRNGIPVEPPREPSETGSASLRCPLQTRGDRSKVGTPLIRHSATPRTSGSSITIPLKLTCHCVRPIFCGSPGNGPQARNRSWCFFTRNRAGINHLFAHDPLGLSSFYAKA